MTFRRESIDKVFRKVKININIVKHWGHGGVFPQVMTIQEHNGHATGRNA